MEYRYCQDCGRINDSAGKYCPHCGKEYIREKRRLCSYCGQSIGIYDSFCTWCGEKCAPEKNEYCTFYGLTDEEVNMITKMKMQTIKRINNEKFIEKI